MAPSHPRRRIARLRSRSAGAATFLALGAVLAASPAAPAAWGADAEPSPPTQADPAAALGCGGCHRGLPDGGIRERTPALGGDADPARTFAALGAPDLPAGGRDAARMPDFRLDEGERVALTLFLAGEGGGGAYGAARARHAGLSAADGDRIFRALNCAACHAHPGVEPRRNAPDLTGEGARVREAWLRAWLAEPGTIRPTGAPSGSWSRMPDFGLDAGEVEALAGRLGAGIGAGGSAALPVLTVHGSRRVEARTGARLACRGCHTVDGRGGALGPPLDGVGARLAPAWLRRVVADPLGALPGGGMPPTPFGPGEADEVARWLAGREAAWRPAPTPSLVDPRVAAAMAAGNAAGDEGAALYGRLCVACHGPAGRGDGWNAAALPVAPTPHAEATLMARRPDDTLFDAIHGGAWVLDGSPAMPPFGGILEPREIRSLVAYIRRLCDCAGPAWSRDGRRPPGPR